MGGIDFDRQVFVKAKHSPSPPSPSRSPLPGALVLILVAALGAFAAYRYIKAGGLSSVPVSNDAQVKQLQQKITVLQARIDQLERRRRTPLAKASAEDEKAPEPQLARAPAAELTYRAVAHASAPPAQKPLVAASTQPKASAPVFAGGPPQPSGAAQPNPALNKLQGDLAATHEEWEATVNRLGNVVGQLDTQQSQLEQNQNAVKQLLGITRRMGIPFSLKKQSEFQRVGPISLKLSSTDVADQRYTLRLVVDDKSVELKDRALNEVIEFYTERSQFPVELVVSQIERGQVAGMLAVPADMNSPGSQMQAR
jgi:outer membrane murein-binding lipoprotein Lpp